VAVEDAGGATVLGDSSTVTLTLSSGTFVGGGTTQTATAVNGVATFGNLAVTAAGGYTLAGGDGRLTRGTAHTFTVTTGTSVYDDFNTAATDFTSNFTVTNDGGANNTSLSWGSAFGIKDNSGAAGGGVKTSASTVIDSTARYTPSQVNLSDGQ